MVTLILLVTNIVIIQLWFLDNVPNNLTDIIHSDSGALGKPDPIGDADFYPNGIVPLMPGCFTIFCSHSRAWEYYAGKESFSTTIITTTTTTNFLIII